MLDKTTTIHNARQTKHQTDSNFHIFKFRVYLILYTRLAIYEIKSLQNFTLRYIYYNESFQIYGILYVTVKT